MPTAYAVTYIFGTIGSALILATLGPRLLRIDLVAACKEYEASLGATRELGGAGQAWHKFEFRAYRVQSNGPAAGLTVAQAETMAAGRTRLFIERVRRDGQIRDATLDLVLQPDDIVAVAGRREQLVNVIGPAALEVDDPDLLAVPVEGVDIYVTSKAIDNKTLQELSTLPAARGVFYGRSSADRLRRPFRYYPIPGCTGAM
jgi:putative transport protein